MLKKFRTTGRRGTARKGNIKILNGKLGLVAYRRKDLFKRMDMVQIILSYIDYQRIMPPLSTLYPLS